MLQKHSHSSNLQNQSFSAKVTEQKFMENMLLFNFGCLTLLPQKKFMKSLQKSTVYLHFIEKKRDLM